MTEPAWQRDLIEAMEAALVEQARAERFKGPQGLVQRTGAGMVDRPRPLEFDGNGFPLAQPTPSFVTRVARLLGE